jgi:hypothetical protein
MIPWSISLQPRPWYPSYKNVTSLLLHTLYKTGHFCICQSQPTYILPISLMNQEFIYLGVCVCVCVYVQIHMHVDVLTCIN